MVKRRELVLKAYLSQCPLEKKEAFLKQLSPSEQKRLADLPEIPLLDEKPVNLMDRIHWSWFIPFLETCKAGDRKLFLSVVNPMAKKNLGRMLKTSESKGKLKSSAISFLKKTLIESVVEKEILPPSMLPPSPLNTLLQIEKKKLTQLIDFLSLYDFSSYLRQIVETKILKKIYSFLSEEEKKFLKAIAGHKEPYPTAKINLDKWDGTKKTFRLALHRIGLARFGSALAGQDPDLIWYVCHELDIGRGKALEKLCKSQEMPGVAEWLAKQMKELL